MRTLATLLAAAGILCFMTPMTQAQTATGQIVGVVTDPSWAVVAGAKVALTSDAGVRRESATGGNDRYTFPDRDAFQFDRCESAEGHFEPIGAWVEQGATHASCIWEGQLTRSALHIGVRSRQEISRLPLLLAEGSA
jgi:hypothetical protein